MRRRTASRQPGANRPFTQISCPSDAVAGEPARAPLKRSARALVAALMPALLLAGCSGGEDVRVRLCKDIVAVRSGAAPVFQTAETRTRGYEHAEVRLGYSVAGESGTASCFYNHNAVEDTADQLANPLAAYSTSPYRVIIGMETLPRPVLAEAIKQAMLKQGRQFLEQAGDAAREAINR